MLTFEKLPNWLTLIRKHCFLRPQTQSECISCLAKQQISIVPYHPDYAKSFFRRGNEVFITLSGIPNRSTLLCNEGGPWQSFQADPYGFSNSPYVWEEKKLDIVLLGDSFTIGECIPQNERFANLIQTAYPKTLNLGYPKSGPLSELARYVEYGHDRKPKQLFIFYYELNDAPELLEEYSHPILKRYLDDRNFSQNLMAKKAVIEQGLGDWMSEQIDSHPKSDILQFNRSRGLFSGMWKRFFYESLEAAVTPKPQRPNPDPIIPLIRRVIGRFAELTKQTETRVTLLYLPSKSGDFRFYRDDLQRVVTEAGMQFVNLEEVFSVNQLEPYSGFEPFHYNSAAHKLIAEAVIKESR